MKKWFWFVFFGVDAVVIALAILIFKGYVRFNYPSDDAFPLKGIDISHHQRSIDWSALSAEEISFVIIKATEGGDFRDAMFPVNWELARGSGYRTGAYHFYRLCKGGQEQAQNFIDVVPVNDDNLPPAIDLEFGGNCSTEKSKNQILAEIRECLTLLEKHYNKKPIIYATTEFYDEYLIGVFHEYPLWIRDIFGKPELPDRNWQIWQFANRGHLKGIETYVDLNVINGKDFGVLE